MPIIKSIQSKTKELLTYHCGCHSNQVTIATRYVADVYYSKEALCQMYSQYDFRPRIYKVTKLMSLFPLLSLFPLVSPIDCAK